MTQLYRIPAHLSSQGGNGCHVALPDVAATYPQPRRPFLGAANFPRRVTALGAFIQRMT